MDDLLTKNGNSIMTSTPNRLLFLTFTGLTAIALIVTYFIWMVLDDVMRSIWEPWLSLVIALMIGLVILSPGLLRRHHRRLYILLMGLFTTALIIGWNVDWSPTKPFYRFYRAIHTGMSIDAVQYQLNQAFPQNGPYPKPRTEGGPTGRSGQVTQYFRLEPPLSAEVITVEFEQGRVIKAEYSPD